MENLNATNNSMSEIQKMFSDYKNSQTKKAKFNSADLLAKYFEPKKPKETFRILPPLKGQKHYFGDEAKFHVVETNNVDKYGNPTKRVTKIYCPAHNNPKVQKVNDKGEPLFDLHGKPIMVNERCPLCEKAKKILATQDQSIKGVKKENATPQQQKIFEDNKKIFAEASKWEAKTFYIVRGIDRGIEKDGVKFWRFKHNFKNQGIREKLMVPLEDFVNQYEKDFTSPVDGCDLSITTAKDMFKNIEFTTVTAITTKIPSPLHSDPQVAQSWLNDEITWRDVFKPKKAPNITPEQYLDLLVEGNDPYFDQSDPKNKHWVFPNNPELEALANTRNQNLDADDESSDDSEDEGVTISNIKPENVGVIKENAVVFGGKTPTIEETEEYQEYEEVDDSENFDDLPF